MAMCYYKQRRFDAAREQLRKVQELDPKWPLLDLTGAMILIARQNSAEALEAARRAETGIGAVPIALAVLAQAEALSGNKDAARTQVAKLRADARRAYVPAYALSLASYAAGDAGQGYHWLRRAWDDRNGVLVWLGRSPFFDQARKDPRAARLLAQVGNAAYTPE